MLIKVLVVDDHQLFRQGLINMLSESPDIEVIAEATNGLEAIERVSEFKPDIVLMDIGMPGKNGIEATRYIHQNFSESRVIALSMHADKHYIKTMLEAGAFGYLFKNCTYNQLIEGITTVAEGEKYLGGEATEVLIQSYLGKEDATEDLIKETKLSEREFEVLKLLAEGKSTREVSEILFISVKTVGTHKQNLLEKLELKSTADLVKYALKKGIIHI
ncbi:MAG: response regulator transcription factor [Bacteroidota bacterium]|nr:response regulator transcription factor [Bacteroidota bacterium]